ncbi:KxYKxGKxW signal peptide domain-containing protein, partial [Pseudolactococcus laudensis]|uniref:KxYKxGKxW signal peptide domain-containing protein n=1 Tax=Pseudolactococcus laudensis TaxID=1494461 RepID=UPI003F972AEE
MSLSHMKKSSRAKQESKVSHFRAWKSGKIWLYGASILASLFVFGLAPTFVTNPSFGSIVVQADAAKSGTTILVNSGQMNGAKYIYIWNQNTGSIDGQMSYVGNGYFAYTYSGAAPSAITLDLKNSIGGLVVKERL